MAHTVRQNIFGMNRILLSTFCILGFCLSAYSQTKSSTITEQNQAPQAVTAGKGEMKFETELHDFDTLEYSGNGTYEFKFKNTGTEPIIITETKASCGCTVPVYPKNTPVKPGESQSIKVTYDTKRPGTFNKSITIYSNAKESVKVINIKGFVKNKPVEPPAFPLNNSPQGGFIPLEK